MMTSASERRKHKGADQAAKDLAKEVARAVDVLDKLAVDKRYAHVAAVLSVISGSLESAHATYLEAART